MAQDMTPAQQPQNAPATKSKGGRKRRVAAWYREACRIRVHEGDTWDNIAQRVGVSPAGLHKARKQPHNIEVYKQTEAQYIQEVEALKAPHKARALEVARELLDGAKSESVKARMVEFLAGEGKGSSVNVAVNVQNNVGGGDYEFVRPGQKMVVIEPNTDTQSVDRDDQEPTE